MIAPDPYIVHQPCGQVVFAASHLELRAVDQRVVTVTTVRCHTCHVTARKEVGSAVSPRAPRFRRHGPTVEVPW